MLNERQQHAYLQRASTILELIKADSAASPITPSHIIQALFPLSLQVYQALAGNATSDDYLSMMQFPLDTIAKHVRRRGQLELAATLENPALVSFSDPEWLVYVNETLPKPEPKSARKPLPKQQPKPSPKNAASLDEFLLSLQPTIHLPPVSPDSRYSASDTSSSDSDTGSSDSDTSSHTSHSSDRSKYL